MSISSVIDLLACAAQLTLALVCFARVRVTPNAWFLGWLCVCVTAWSASELLFKLTGRLEWTLADHAISPLTAPVVLDFALHFDGRRHAMRRLLVTAYLLSCALGAVSVVALFVPLTTGVQAFVASRGWTVLMLCMGIPTMAFSLVSYVAHLQRSVEPLEEKRTRLVLAAFAIAVILGATDVLGTLAPSVPALGRIGLLVGTFGLALVSLRFPWAESGPRVVGFTYAFAAGGVALLVYLAVFGFADAMASGLVLGTVTVSIALIVASRRWVVEAAVAKERSLQLATLGRFSAQMAHDLKNPLAAMKGAAQLVRDDVAPRSASLVALMLDQIDRLTRVVDTYGRLARIDVVRTTVDINTIVREVVALQALAPARDGGEAALLTDLADPLPECLADRDMIASVIENLVRNALEALPRGGTVTVRTRVSAVEGPFGVRLDVEDTGVGMDKLTRDRAFDDFFTTKPTGSGLGLAFVRRVVHAHGGEVKLTSEPGRGTLVRIQLPV